MEVSGARSAEGETPSIYFEMTQIQTSSLEAGNYIFDVRATLSNSHNISLVLRGEATVATTIGV